MPSTNQISDTQFYCSFRNVTTFGKVSGQTLTGITKIKFDFFNRQKSYARAQIGENLYVGGGMLFAYDGLNLVEDGFNWNPEIKNIYLPTGTAYQYSYVAVWEWVDNAGNLHRSAPSTPVIKDTTHKIGEGVSALNIHITSLSLTDKTAANDRSPIVCVLYRTKGNGQNYFKLPVTSNNTNITTNNIITIGTDNTKDDDLVDPLYTTGDVLPNDAPPPIGALVVHRNRLFALDSNNPLVVYYSKQVRPGVPVEWSDAQTLNIDPTGGDVIGLAHASGRESGAATI